MSNQYQLESLVWNFDPPMIGVVYKIPEDNTKTFCFEMSLDNIYQISKPKPQSITAALFSKHAFLRENKTSGLSAQIDKIIIDIIDHGKKLQQEEDGIRISYIDDASNEGNVAKLPQNQKR